MRRPGAALAALLVWLALSPPGALAQRRPTVEVRPRHGPPVVVVVEVADDDAERARGLMFRRDLAPDTGMLFVFPDEAVRTFWMRNTPLPLDMLFIGTDGRLRGCVERAEPFTDAPRSVPAPARYVLEVNAGFCARHALAAGDRIVLRDVPGLSGTSAGPRP
jgi:uncharacterized membrane protein (UPF0127 family)